MEITLQFSKIILRLHLKQEVMIDDRLEKFACANYEKADCEVFISWNWESRVVPRVPMTGQDLIQNYYIEPHAVFCETQGGERGPVASCMCALDFSEIHGTVNLENYAYIPKKLDWIMRTLPMRAIFQQFGTLFFHAAQITVNGVGILFTAPSGTGKTTQAKLWETYRGAKRVCADRTLVRHMPEGWRTFGYPLDGSEPICSAEEHALGAVVLLRQGRENTIVRLTGGRAVAALMPQMVIDGWNAQARIRAAELLTDLLEEIPVYQLTCVDGKTAVECLDGQLCKDRVIM